ncbi:MAG: DNA-processing protein DprA [Gammaproteobacteria bacterium]
MCSASPASLRAADLTPRVIQALLQTDPATLAHAEHWCGQPEHHLIHWQHPDFPPLLREISDPPVVLFLRGKPAALKLPQLAIVGSRKASPAGLDTARWFAAQLGQAGLGITSGLALGIDAAAHTAAIAADATTLAVCGTGPDIVYPRGHHRLAQAITAAGAVLTEFPPGNGPRRANFPRRNRIISGLALGVLVVEAGERSGALITARLAAAQGREVFAVPGSIRHPLTRGCHRLIRDGAALVERPADIAAELRNLLGTDTAPVEQNIGRPQADATDAAKRLGPGAARLLDVMGWEAVSLEQLLRWTGLTSANLCSMLVTLELAGRVSRLTGGRYQQRED